MTPADTSDAGAECVARLAAGEPIDAAVAVVVAHPDDEVLGVGARLDRLRDWRLIHLTDGAPRDMHDARRAGFATPEAYVRARSQELDDALHALGATPSRRANYACADQQAITQLVPLTLNLVDELAHVEIVITHSYEHGHPDHDAAAFCVHAACALLDRRARLSPSILEFAGYHLYERRLICGSFWPDERMPVHTAVLSADEVRRKRTAIECFRSQHEFLQLFPLQREHYRASPGYDFTVPAPPLEAFYETMSWNVTRADWYARVRDAQRELELGAGRLL